MNFRFGILSFLVILTTTVAAAKGNHVSDSTRSAGRILRDTLPNDTNTAIVEKFAIHYKVDSVKINPTYLDNRRQMDRIKHYLNNSPRIDSITIFAWSSPEGRYSRNRWLSNERAKAAKAYLLKHSPDSVKLNADKIKISPIAENWSGLLDLVEENYNGRDREQLLAILKDCSIDDQTRKTKLHKLNRGQTWNYLVENYMHSLRTATWVCVWVEAPPVLPPVREVRDTLICHRGDIVMPPSPIIEQKEDTVIVERETVLALKSNLLYDVLTLVNYSVEIPVFDNDASLLVYHQFPWWTGGRADNEFCLRFLSVGSEARWWFAPGDKRLTGHFIGLYGESGKYDFQFKESICRQGEFWSAGISYGYSMPVGRKQKMHLEISLSAGYASIAYRGYTPSEDYEILWKDPETVGRYHYFGPTKVTMTLVVPIMAKVRKGGER